MTALQTGPLAVHSSRNKDVSRKGAKGQRKKRDPSNDGCVRWDLTGIELLCAILSASVICRRLSVEQDGAIHLSTKGT